MFVAMKRQLSPGRATSCLKQPGRDELVMSELVMAGGAGLTVIIVAMDGTPLSDRMVSMYLQRGGDGEDIPLDSASVGVDWRGAQGIMTRAAAGVSRRVQLPAAGWMWIARVERHMRHCATSASFAGPARSRALHPT